MTEALGGDRRIADRNHATAVARLQAQIEQARLAVEPARPTLKVETRLSPITPADYDHAVWPQYTHTLESDTQKRASMPTLKQMNAERERLLERIDKGEIGPHLGLAGMINAYTDYQLMLRARDDDGQNRARRLAALRLALAGGDIRLIEPVLRLFVDNSRLAVEPNTPEWHELAHRMLRAEIEALERTVERDKGNYSGEPTDPIVRVPTKSAIPQEPVPLKALFNDYIASRQSLGKNRDDGANWNYAIRALVTFVGHDDARRITRRNLLDWRDSLLANGKAPKTVSDKYLAAIRAILSWAHENEWLPTNEAAKVKQEVPRKVRTRERGYTTTEAIRILKTSFTYKPAEVTNPSNRESAPITAAKRWIPLLCAFTGVPGCGQALELAGLPGGVGRRMISLQAAFEIGVVAFGHLS